MGDHVLRTTPSFNDYRTEFPVFALGKDGNLVGPFKIYKNPYYGFRLRLLSEKGLLRKVSPFARAITEDSSWMMMSSKERVKTTAKVVIESKSLFDERFKGEFYVVIWDSYNMSAKEIELFESILRANRVNVIVPEDMPTGMKKTIHIKDGHPSAERNLWMAEQLYNNIIAKAHAGNP